MHQFNFILKTISESLSDDLKLNDFYLSKNTENSNLCDNQSEKNQKNYYKN